jgi:hypothetical protein
VRLVVRHVDMDRGAGARDGRLADESPALAVLSTAGDTVADWLAAGQALQRLLLVAAQWGLQAAYLNQPVQAAALRPRLQQLTDGPGCAQMLLCLGAPLAPGPAAPRRPLADVLVAD